MKKTLATSFMARLGVAGAIASATLFGLPATAQDSRLSLADRVARLEQQSQAQAGTTTLVNQVNDLQQQVSQLQGQIEELQHQNQQLQDSQKAQYADVDSRLGRLEKGGAAPQGQPAASAPQPAASGGQGPAGGQAAMPAPATSTPTQPASGDQQAAYDTAFKSLRAGDYVTASRGFRDFLIKYPDSPLAPNAYYWLGESYYVTMNYPVAIEAFQRLVKQFPQSDKVSDGLLKVGYCQIELKQQDAAIATLKQVTTKYPGTKAAGLAQERLRRLQRQTAN
ncbi:MAG: tol-pal system protein YbgF [Luteibacter sp.]